MISTDPRNADCKRAAAAKEIRRAIRILQAAEKTLDGYTPAHLISGAVSDLESIAEMSQRYAENGWD